MLYLWTIDGGENCCVGFESIEECKKDFEQKEYKEFYDKFEIYEQIEVPSENVVCLSNIISIINKILDNGIEEEIIVDWGRWPCDSDKMLEELRERLEAQIMEWFEDNCFPTQFYKMGKKVFPNE